MYTLTFVFILFSFFRWCESWQSNKSPQAWSFHIFNAARGFFNGHPRSPGLQKKHGSLYPSLPALIIVCWEGSRAPCFCSFNWTTLDGRNPIEIPNNHLALACNKNPANNGMNYQPQVVSRISEPSTVWFLFIFIRPGPRGVPTSLTGHWFLKSFLRVVRWWSGLPATRFLVVQKKTRRLWVMLLWKGFSESWYSNTTKTEKERFRDAQYVKAKINTLTKSLISKPMMWQYSI